MPDVVTIYFDKMLEIIEEMLSDPYWTDYVDEHGIDQTAYGPVVDMFMHEFLGKCSCLCYPEPRARDAENDDEALCYLEDAGLSEAFALAMRKKDWRLADMCMWQAMFMDSGAQFAYDSWTYDVD